MTSGTATAAAPATGSRRDADWWLAVLATFAVAALHIYFLALVGGLYRDEVSSINLAKGDLANISHDSFPVLFPLLLRGWNGLGLCDADTTARLLGVCLGLGLLVVLWVTAAWTRRAPPLWSLVLVALNAWVIYYCSALRAYGLGSALIALAVGAAWRFSRNPGRKEWMLFAIVNILSVQALYQNSVLVASVCAGACVVIWRENGLTRATFARCGAVFLAGLVAAISLLPYFHNVAGMSQGAAPLRMDFDSREALTDLDTLLAYPLPQFFWLWMILLGAVLAGAIIGLVKCSRDDRSLFAAVTLMVGAVAYCAFLKQANFPIQPWYFVPPVAMAGVCLEMSLPRPAGKFRAVFFGGLAAAAVISGLFALKVLDYRFTNVDGFAKKTSRSAGTNDLVIVTPWQMGITFARYYHGPGEWITVPPLSDHSVHRFDLIQKMMADPQVMTPVLVKAEATLRAGGAVWVVGGLNDISGTNAPAALPPPPLPHSGWNETPYRMSWNNQLAWQLRRNATNVECLDQGFADDVNLVERVAFYKVTGWSGK